ncbi:ribonuclease H [Variovorax sp. AB1(2024)]|uniref:ribonuclease H family protein n=1 Tax=Variovorax sp. AB1(2024) TaxID=3132214 RepID=UPI0030B6A5F3
MIRVFTDGSCWPNDGTGNGGWSFVAYQNGVEMFSHCGGASKTTSNQMELTGMLEALRWLGHRHAVVLSDSRYVVSGLNEWCRGWERRGWMRKEKGSKELQPVANVELWKAAYAARRPCHQVEWVKGHAGIIGNVRADRLAEEARMGVTA